MRSYSTNQEWVLDDGIQSEMNLAEIRKIIEGKRSPVRSASKDLQQSQGASSVVRVVFFHRILKGSEAEKRDGDET
ncbi:hypothetical protein HNR46_003739 [Haloferula luteola]|uniref:Uncharacterized protein n=1 Tax=Haloferula luteola TaxID=595692 RepID=A0A840VFU9_9BACT|nr:hypothetical protein [Haloferula luteola]MBB5353478.1 hypothetical protein [Haloferula luteola]